MKNADLILQDDILIHQINLLRFTTGEKKKVLAILNQLQKDLRAKLLTDLTDFGKARVNKLLKETEGVIGNGYKTVQQKLDYDNLAKHEAEFTVKSFEGIGLSASLPTEAALKALVNGSLIEGAPSAAWWAKQSDDLAFKFAAQVRQGVAGNETVQQIVRRIIGSPILGMPGIMETSRRGAMALVHTSIQQVANDARSETFKANSDILKGVRFLATLDSHTSLTCVSYSGSEWDMDGKPIGGTIKPYAQPPLHFNCRSVLVPITKTYRELGLDIDEVPPGTRSSDLGQIPSDTTFDAFLKRHDAAYVDNLLGPGRAQLWREGKITLSQLVGQTGQPLTLEQLKRQPMLVKPKAIKVKPSWKSTPGGKIFKEKDDVLKYNDYFKKYSKEKLSTETMKQFIIDEMPLMKEGFKEWKSSTTRVLPSALKYLAEKVEKQPLKARIKQKFLEFHVKLKITDELKDQYIRLRALQQAQFKQDNIKSLTLYRGTDGSKTGPAMREKFNSIVKLKKAGWEKELISIEENSLVGYSSEQSIGNYFGKNNRGVTMTKKFLVKDIVICWDRIFQGVLHSSEMEIIVLGGKKTVKLGIFDW